MGYVAGEKILDDEYNNFVGSSSDPYGINHLIGTGSGRYGLGNSGVITTLTGNTGLITASQWNLLFTAMDNLTNHTNDTLTSTTARVAGDPIAIKSALVADLATLAASVAAGCPSATAVSAGSEDRSEVASAVFDTSHIVEDTVTFAGGDEARWFFNAGGKIRVSLTNNATGSTDKDTSVSNLITSMGNFDLGANTNGRSGTGDTPTTEATETGYYDLGTSYTTLMHLDESAGTYANNIELKIEAKVNSAHGDGRNNNGEVVTLKCSVLLNDGTRTDYSSNNLSSVAVEAEAAGTTDWSFRTVDPTTAQGLDTVYTSVTIANASNAIVNND